MDLARLHAAREEAKSATREAIVAAAIDTVMAERSFAITLNPGPNAQASP